MSNNFRSLLFTLLFICLANFLFSQEEGVGIKNRITWTRDNYAIHYEVLIEKEEDNNYSLVLREFTEEPFIIISLPPGDYRIRVIPYDYRNIPSEGTKWKNFKVIAVTTPTEDQTADADSTKPEKQEDSYIALLAGGMGYSRYNIAIGSGITFGKSLNGKGIGFSLLYINDSENFIFLEMLAHYRLYQKKENNTGMFMQVESGMVFFSYEKFKNANNNSFVGALSMGWRFMLDNQWYIEPFIRTGYPFIFGAGFSTGFKVDSKNKE